MVVKCGDFIKKREIKFYTKKIYKFSYDENVKVENWNGKRQKTQEAFKSPWKIECRVRESEKEFLTIWKAQKGNNGLGRWKQIETRIRLILVSITKEVAQAKQRTILAKSLMKYLHRGAICEFS